MSSVDVELKKDGEENTETSKTSFSIALVTQQTHFIVYRCIKRGETNIVLCGADHWVWRL